MAREPTQRNAGLGKTLEERRASGKRLLELVNLVDASTRLANSTGKEVVVMKGAPAAKRLVVMPAGSTDVPAISRTARVTLIENHRKVLEALQKVGTCTMLQIDIAEATGLSRDTVSDCLRYLHEKGLVDTPHGKRKGWVLTSLGWQFVASD
jgi:uncharacterized membrane protein